MDLDIVVNMAILIVLPVGFYFLRHGLNRDLEELRDELARQRKEQEVRFTQLHLRRANVIEGLYAALDSLQPAPSPYRWRGREGAAISGTLPDRPNWPYSVLWGLRT